MTASILYLFPDTNIFIECRPLEKLDWSRWSEFDEVHLIVCHTVVREIDAQKTYHRRQRVNKRAKAAYTKFSQLARAGGAEQWTIRERQPAVRLLLAPLGRPSPAFSDVLDYSKSDDEIVGYLGAYVEQHPDADARLLTHDAGPTMTARSLGLRVEDVSDDWLLPPESSDVERENARLKEELRTLRKTEPEFDVAWDESVHSDNGQIALSATVWQPLSSDDIERHIEALQQLRTPTLTRKRGQLLTGMITAPTRQQHDEWISECKDVLANLHIAMQYREDHPSLSLRATNTGSCPGADVLVTISAEGSFKLYVPWAGDSRFDPMDTEAEQRLRLPSPPKPRTILGEALTGAYLSGPDLLGLSSDLASPPRDLNEFYYRPQRPLKPVASIELECQQWRHKSAPEVFTVEVFVADVVSDVSGALKCRIEAGNLSEPVEHTFPLSIAVQPVSSGDAATDMIDRYLKEYHL